jgi:hypothetical protein
MLFQNLQIYRPSTLPDLPETRQKNASPVSPQLEQRCIALIVHQVLLTMEFLRLILIPSLLRNLHPARVAYVFLLKRNIRFLEFISQSG